MIKVTFSKQVVFDEITTPDEIIVSKEGGIRGGGTEAERERIAAFYNTDWHYVGVQAKADILIPFGKDSITCTLKSPGLWAIESDSDRAYFEKVYQEELETAVFVSSRIPLESTIPAGRGGMTTMKLTNVQEVTVRSGKLEPVIVLGMPIAIPGYDDFRFIVHKTIKDPGYTLSILPTGGSIICVPARYSVKRLIANAVNVIDSKGGATRLRNRMEYWDREIELHDQREVVS